jgi:hypothetical protein
MGDLEGGPEKKTIQSNETDTKLIPPADSSRIGHDVDKVEPAGGRDHLVTKCTGEREDLLPNRGDTRDLRAG